MVVYMIKIHRYIWVKSTEGRKVGGEGHGIWVNFSWVMSHDGNSLTHLEDTYKNGVRALVCSKPSCLFSTLDKLSASFISRLVIISFSFIALPLCYSVSDDVPVLCGA